MPRDEKPVINIDDITNNKKETLDTVITGRVYKRYKDYIDENNINIGQLIMKTLDSINPKLKK